MIQYNNSNPDYGVPEYEGGEDDNAMYSLPVDNDDEKNPGVINMLKV